MTTAQDRWWHPFTSIGDIAVYRIDLVPHLRHEADALVWLDGEERSRRQRFQSLPARRRFVLCRAALRAVLCSHLSCPNESLTFEAAEHGKPYAKVEAIEVATRFNVSHSGEHGLIAVAPGGRLGVDVEERAPRKKLENLIEGVFSPQEQIELNQLEGPQKLHTFFRFWTIKEALVKAHGKGLSMKVAELEIPADMRQGATKSKCQFAQIPNMTWHLEDISTDEFAAAVAYEVEPTS